MFDNSGVPPMLMFAIGGRGIYFAIKYAFYLIVGQLIVQTIVRWYFIHNFQDELIMFVLWIKL